MTGSVQQAGSYFRKHRELVDIKFKESMLTCRDAQCYTHQLQISLCFRLVSELHLKDSFRNKFKLEKATLLYFISN